MKAANDNHLFYAYIWRDGAGQPFYVGKGKGSRAYGTTRRSEEFKRIHAMGGCTVEIVDYFIHESQAHAFEVELIARYGRRDMGGQLVNKTDGGEGVSGVFRSAEVRAKLRDFNLGKTLDADHRAKISDALSGATHSPEHRAKLSVAIRSKAPKNGFKGVKKHRGKWAAGIPVARKNQYLGTFPTPEEAARAYDDAVERFWGPGPWYRNFPAAVAA